MEALRKSSDKEEVSYEQVKNSIQNFSLDEARRFVEQGAKHEFAVQVAGQTLFVPPGWLLLEQSARGVLLYGARQTMVVKSEKATETYATLMGIMAKDGKSITSMQTAAPALEIPEE